MRILLIPSAYYPSLGGVEELTRQLAKTYSQQGHHVIVATSKSPDSSYKEVVDTVSVYRFHFQLPAKNILTLLKFIVIFPITLIRFSLLCLSFKPDVLHIQCSSSNTLYATLMSKILRIPLILTSQGETKMDAAQIYQKSAFMKKTLVFGLKRAAFVTACSQATLDDINHNYLNVKHKSQVIFNGINPSEFDAISISGDAKERYIFATGRLTLNKGFDLLIQAFKDLPSAYNTIQLFIGGSGEQEMELKNLIASSGLENRVCLLGRLNREQTVTYMKKSLFVVMPSRYEPFGIVALEGMAAGKDVIVTKHGGPPEFIIHGKHGLIIDPFDISDFSLKLANMINSHTELNKINLNYVKTKFSWDQISIKYLDLYKMLLGGVH
jgi:glycogen synthase